MADEKHTMLIDIPADTKKILAIEAEKDDRKLKPYIELVLIKHAASKSIENATHPKSYPSLKKRNTYRKIK